MGSHLLSLALNLIGMTGSLVPPRVNTFIYWSGVANSKSKWNNRRGMAVLTAVSAKFLPRQMRLPPRKGVKARGFLFSLFGLRKRSWLISKRSGKNSSGLCHSLGQWCMAVKFNQNAIPALKVILWMVVSLRKHRVPDIGAGGAILRVSKKQLRVNSNSLIFSHSKLFRMLCLISFKTGVISARSLVLTVGLRHKY